MLTKKSTILFTILTLTFLSATKVEATAPVPKKNPVGIIEASNKF